MKTLGILGVGLLAGVLLAIVATRHFPAEPLSPAAADGAQDRFSSFEDSMENRLAAIEQQLTAIVAQIETLHAADNATGVERVTQTAERAVQPGNALAMMGEARNSLAQREINQLLAAGFSRDRIDWINRRIDERRLEAQKSYSQTPTAESFEVLLNPVSSVRSDLGDDEYERYLDALGRATGVGVQEVLTGSPAEAAGFQSGDVIVSYDGTRLFHAFELARLMEEEPRDEPVLVDVRRDGQLMQLVVPRGPSGIVEDRLGDFLR